MTRLRRPVEGLLARFGFQLVRTGDRSVQRLLDSTGTDLVFDVGAAKGLYGAALRGAGFEGTIVSCEPLTSSRRELEGRALRDQRWFVEPVAIGATRGEGEIHIAANRDSSSLLPMLEAHVAAAPNSSYVGSERVSIETLNEVFGRHQHRGKRPFVKIDTQGFERDVLEGGDVALAAAVGLQMEVSFVALYEGAMLEQEAFARAAAAGFHPALALPAFREPGTGRWLQADVVFLRGS